MRVKSIAKAGRAFGCHVDPRRVDAGADQRTDDESRQIEREAAARMRDEARGGHGPRDIGTHGVTTRMDAQTDRNRERRCRDAVPPQALDRPDGNSAARSAPAAVEQGAPARVRRDDRDRGAIRDGDPHPRIAGANENPVRLGARLGGRDERDTVDLARHAGSVFGHARFRPHAPSVLEDRLPLIADAEAEIQRGVGSGAHAAETRRHAEPRPVGQSSGAGPPEDRGGFPRIRVGTHGRSIFAAGRGLAQGLCAALLLAVGCARVPPAASGADARARFLDTYARGEPASRGAGALSARRGTKRQGTLDLRWASSAESVVVVGFAGPVRALDATLLGESVYVALRPMDLGMAGLLPRNEGLGARGLRFLTRPWDFSSVWIHGALERTSVESIEKGWRLSGTIDSDSGTHPYALDLD